MNNYVQNRLQRKISQDLGIPKADDETEKSWTERFVYSAIANAAYTSLWDIEEDADISVTHFKDCLKNQYSMFHDIFPIISEFTDDEISDFSEYIYGIYLNAGCFYHSAYRISPCIRTAEDYQNTVLLRGQSPNENIKMSGVGYYLENTKQASCVKNMWNISETTLGEEYSLLLQRGGWQKFDSNYGNCEFLNISKKAGAKYFINHPPEYSGISLMRMNLNGVKNYYLFRNDNEPQYLQLSDDETRNGEWLTIANAIWMKNGLRPGIYYQQGPELTTINIKYILPPSFRDFYLLYTWPVELKTYNNIFKRLMSNVVFPYFVDKLEQSGYSIIRQEN